MEFSKTEIEGLVVITPNVFKDDRGYFFESYNKSVFQEQGITANFVQDNQSMSQQGVLRGLHFQKPPYSQAKLVSVIKGSVLDVVVDIRGGSPTYGKYFSIVLSEENKKMLFVPEGFAHGFLTLESDTIFSYKCSNFYNKQSEDAILWNDSDLAINWDINNPVLSNKDKIAKSFNDFITPF